MERNKEVKTVFSTQTSPLVICRIVLHKDSIELLFFRMPATPRLNQMNTFRAADTARHDEDLAVEASSMSLPDEIHCTFGFTVDADQNDGRPALVDNLQC